MFFPILPSFLFGHLKHQDEVVDRFVPLVQEVLRRALVLLIKLEVLDHAGMFDQPQQDLV